MAKWRLLGRDRLHAALRDHGPSNSNDIAKMLGVTYSAAISLIAKEKAAGRAIAVGHGKVGLPGVRAWIRVNQIITQVLFDAPDHQMRQYRVTAALVAGGRSPRISTQLTTLRRSGVIGPPNGGLLKLSSSAVEKIERGETIYDARGRVLWAPEMKKLQPKAVIRKIIYTDKVSGNERICAGLRDHGPCAVKELAEITGMTCGGISSLISKYLKPAGKVVTVGHGKYALPDSGTETRMPAEQIIVDTVFAASGHQLKLSSLRAALVAAGRSSNISSQLWTLRKNNVLASADRGPVRFTSDAVEKIKRGEPIHDPRGRVLWTSRARSD